MDELTLTIRVHDSLEKTKAEKAAVWVVAKVPRADLQNLPDAHFIELYLAPALKQIKQTLEFNEV